MANQASVNQAKANQTKIRLRPSIEVFIITNVATALQLIIVLVILQQLESTPFQP